LGVSARPRAVRLPLPPCERRTARRLARNADRADARRRPPAERRGRDRIPDRPREGGHQIRNDGDEPARVLIVSTNADPDVSEYDTGKVGIWVGGSGRFFRVEDAVEHGGPE